MRSAGHQERVCSHLACPTNPSRSKVTPHSRLRSALFLEAGRAGNEVECVVWQTCSVHSCTASLLLHTYICSPLKRLHHHHHFQAVAAQFATSKGSPSALPPANRRNGSRQRRELWLCKQHECGSRSRRRRRRQEAAQGADERVQLLQHGACEQVSTWDGPAMWRISDMLGSLAVSLCARRHSTRRSIYNAMNVLVSVLVAAAAAVSRGGGPGIGWLARSPATGISGGGASH